MKASQHFLGMISSGIDKGHPPKERFLDVYPDWL
jgi:hypothetical protein